MPRPVGSIIGYTPAGEPIYSTQPGASLGGGTQAENPHGVVTYIPTPVIKRRPPPKITPWTWEDYVDYLARGGGPTPASVNSAMQTIETRALDASPNLPVLYGTNFVRGQRMQAVLRKDLSSYFFGPEYGVLWLALGEGEIDSILEYYLNGWSFALLNEKLGAGTYQYELFPGDAAQAEDPHFYEFLQIHPGALPGVAYVRVEIYRRTDGKAPCSSWVYSLPGYWGPYAGVIPSNPDPPKVETFLFDFLVKGKKVYDPRTTQLADDPSTWTYSENPFLQWRDLRLMSGVDNASINDTSVATAANAADATTWIGHDTTDGTKRFVSHLAVAQQAPLSSHIDQLSLACNGHESWVDGKMVLTCDVEQAGAPVLTLDSTENFSTITYSWLERRDRPTQVRIDFRNKASSPTYTPDFVVVPETLATGVESVMASYTSSAITDRAHAARAATYIYNVANGTPFGVSGDCTYEGISALGRGTKVALITSEGVGGRASTDLYPKGPTGDVQEMLVDVGYERPTGWHMTLRQYDEDIYRDAAVTGTQPIHYVEQQHIPEFGEPVDWEEIGPRPTTNVTVETAAMEATAALPAPSAFVMATPMASTSAIPQPTVTAGQSYSVDVLIVAGGGGGGQGGGGGGGGGMVVVTGKTVNPGASYTVTVGPRGDGAAAGTGRGNDGGNSVFDATTAYGGGGGAGVPAANNGGAGGGASTFSGTGGTGSQGGNGGNLVHTTWVYNCGAGGGGGGASGGGGGPCHDGYGTGGSGGVGTYCDFSGTNHRYSGGGGGSSAVDNVGSGGDSGGGRGGGPYFNPTDASGYGGGGGGADQSRAQRAGHGYQGIVIVRYSGTQRGTGGSVSMGGGYTIHTFTSSGSYVG